MQFLSNRRLSVSNVLRYLAQFTVILSLTVSPWIFGGVQYNVQALLCAAALVAGAFCVASEMLSRGHVESGNPVLPFVPFLLIVFIALLQLLPTPWRSLYPAATRLEVARLVMAAGFFATSTVVFRTASSRALLWGTLGLNGAILAFFGIAHKLRPDAGIFTYVPTHGGAPFASFVSKNSAAGYLNLCVAAGVGLLVWSQARRTNIYDNGERRPSSVDKPGHKFRPSHHARAYSQTRLGGLQLFAIGLIVVCLAGIFCSMARGASVAALGAGAITAWSVPRRSRLLMVIVCLAVASLSFGLISWSGMIPQVESRLATLSGDELTQNGRWAHWADALRAVSQSWSIGSGLGTYRFAYLPFQATSWDIWFHHAENQYLETLLETGITGLAALIAIMTMIVLLLRKLFKRGEVSSFADIRMAGLIAFGCMALQSVSDFPLVIPANMLFFAVICGAITGSQCSAPLNTPPESRHRFLPRKTRLITVWATALFFAYGAFGFYELKVAADIQTVRDVAPNVQTLVPGDISRDSQLRDLDDHLDTLIQLANTKPDDAELQAQIAELWIARYRLQSFAQLIALLSPEEATSGKQAELWNQTNPTVLYVKANRAHQTGHPDLVGELRQDSLVAQNLRPASKHLQLAIDACSVLPRVNLDLATLAFVNRESPDGEDYLKRELHLSSADSTTLNTIGLCAFSSGRKELANKAFSRSLSLHPERLDDIVSYLAAEQVTTEELIAALPDSPALLVLLATTRFSGHKHGTDRVTLLRRARAILDKEPLEARDGQWHRQYAKVHTASRNAEAAIAEYRTSLQLAPLELETRIELSRMLQQQGRFTEAYDEARVCAALEPERDDIKILIRQLLRKEQPSGE